MLVIKLVFFQLHVHWFASRILEKLFLLFTLITLLCRFSQVLCCQFKYFVLLLVAFIVDIVILLATYI